MKKSILQNAFKQAKQFVKSLKKEPKKATKTFANYFKQKFGKKKVKDDFEPGSLITFRYDAKHKEHKFDKNPLVVSLGYSKKFGKNYFLGINLHWLPKSRRVLVASLIVEMLKDRNNKLEYDDIKPLLKIFEGTPMLRMYIIKRVSKKILRMPPETYKRAASIDYASWHYPSENK